MSITYVLNGAFGPAVNISAFIVGAQANPAGPMPGRLPAVATTNVGTGATALQPINAVPHKTVALGLITCASVLYVSTDPGAVAGVWLHHANAGHVSAADVVAARGALGNPPWASIMSVFAHPGVQDHGYTGSIATMVAQGIPTGNIVEIPQLLVSTFGVDNRGFIGF